MASLRELRRYGLSCGENNKSRPSTTLYHVKLTDTAIRALEAFQNLKVESLPLNFSTFSSYLIKFELCRIVLYVLHCLVLFNKNPSAETCSSQSFGVK